MTIETDLILLQLNILSGDAIEIGSQKMGKIRAMDLMALSAITLVDWPVLELALLDELSHLFMAGETGLG